MQAERPRQAKVAQPKTKEERALNRRWWVIGTVALIVVCFVVVLEASFFEARNAQVSGISRTSEGAVLEALNLQPDTALLRYDTSAASDRIAELAWIKQVEVTRSWPSTVRVVVRERTPSAAVGDPIGSDWLVLSEDGVVVERRMTPPAAVPVIVADAESVAAATLGEPLVGTERVLDIAYGLPLQLDPWITTWTTDADGNVTANLVGSATAEFGAFEDYRTQFVSLASILDGGAPRACLRTIDLSVADNPVLHRDPVCMAQSVELSSS